MRAIVALIVTAWLASFSSPSWAASLQVFPVNVEIIAPGAATTITLRAE